MSKRYEYVSVPFEEEPQCPEPGDVGTPVDINDPQLYSEELWVDQEADAFATSVKLKIGLDMRGVMASSISVDWSH